MAQPRELPSDLEWLRSLEFSPDDLDDDEDRKEERKFPSSVSPTPPARTPDKPRD